MIHYELIFFYILGYRPSEVIRDFGFRKSTAYRFHRIYRKARIEAQLVIENRNSVTPAEERTENNRDDLTEENATYSQRYYRYYVFPVKDHIPTPHKPKSYLCGVGI